MHYKGKEITLDNYWEIFGDFPTDMQDEIRLAVMDNTDILPYVAGCGDDDYKLKQIRLALREGLPKKYIKTGLSSEVIKYLRFFKQNNIDIKLVEKYIGVLSNQSLLYIMGAVKKGADIRNIDFTKFTQELIPIISLGTIKGYPMYIFEGQPELTEEYIRMLMSGMALELDVQPFIKEKWHPDVLRLLFGSARKVDLHKFITYITPKFTVEVVNELLISMEQGVTLDKLAYRDEDGYPVYNEFQLAILRKAMKEGYKNKDIFNPNLSDVEMRKMYEDWSANASKNKSGNKVLTSVIDLGIIDT